MHGFIWGGPCLLVDVALLYQPSQNLLMNSGLKSVHEFSFKDLCVCVCFYFSVIQGGTVALLISGNISRVAAVQS